MKDGSFSAYFDRPNSVTRRSSELDKHDLPNTAIRLICQASHVLQWSTQLNKATASRSPPGDPRGPPIPQVNKTRRLVEFLRQSLRARVSLCGVSRNVPHLWLLPYHPTPSLRSVITHAEDFGSTLPTEKPHRHHPFSERNEPICAPHLQSRS